MTPIDDLLDQLQRDIPLYGHLTAAIGFKQALVERLGVATAHPAVQAPLQLPGMERLRRLPVRPLREVAQAHGRHWHPLWPGGQVHALPRLQVVGPHDDQPLEVIDRAGYLTCLDEVDVRGRSELLLWRDQVLHDVEGDEAQRVRDQFIFDPQVLHAEADHWWVMDSAEPAPVIEEAFWLGGHHAHDFGHWLTEYLPKLATALRAGWSGGMPVLVDASAPATVRTALTALLPADTPLRLMSALERLHVRRLWCAPNVSYPGFCPLLASDDAAARLLTAPLRMATLIQTIGPRARQALDRPTGIERLYLARRPERHKAIVNHAAVDAVLAAHGFVRVLPEEHPFLEQLNLVRQARFIVAPEGSNALLGAFGGPGKQIAILTSPYTQPLLDLGATAAVLGQSLTFLTGPCAQDSPRHTEHPFWCFWNDYRIDPAGLDAWLADWLATAPAAGPA
ncbi:glycosyltransferase family 61 protein [Ideonella oryzae]|uniref:Glycosyltransferase family 61 protein n=1 Tax=Ideonella oryzae TaxID=2937441 RepID=A0ABT1BNY4_9BURK|nr:glycosyltransferase 61 family protein [Ideonella oryzae]MCO5977534.1 glycosyltransferase family 61 protein [Ideonella oryzae]